MWRRWCVGGCYVPSASSVGSRATARCPVCSRPSKSYPWNNPLEASGTWRENLRRNRCAFPSRTGQPPEHLRQPGGISDSPDPVGSPYRHVVPKLLASKIAIRRREVMDSNPRVLNQALPRLRTHNIRFEFDPKTVPFAQDNQAPTLERAWLLEESVYRARRVG